MITEDQLIVAEGEVSIDEFSNSPRIMIRDLYTLEEARCRFAKYLQISIAATQPFNPLSLQQTLSSFLGGSCPIVLRILQDNAQTSVKFGNKWLVKPTDALLTLIKNEMSVEVMY